MDRAHDVGRIRLDGIVIAPLNDRLRKEMIDQQGDIKFDVPWTALDEYLEYLVRRGISPNVAMISDFIEKSPHTYG